MRIAIIIAIILTAASLGLAYAIDTDGDGLSDDVEAKLKSNPRHKDVFIEIDYWIDTNAYYAGGRNCKPRPGFLDFVKKIYAAAPVQNPDGTTGINVHIDIDQAIKTDLLWLGYIDDNGDYNWDDFDSFKQQYFSPSRRNTHHYCLFVTDMGSFGVPSGYSGNSRNKTDTDVNFRKGASDFFVSVGGAWFNTPNPKKYYITQAATFAHELGHNLGLRHGGVDHVNEKPNYLSIMNYLFQMGGIPILVDGKETGLYDFSRLNLLPLDENALKEAKGLTQRAITPWGTYGTAWYVWEDFYVSYDGSRNVDWDGDGFISEKKVSEDLNRDGYLEVLQTGTDWDLLVFNGGWIGKAGSGMRTADLCETNRLIELSIEKYREMQSRRIRRR